MSSPTAGASPILLACLGIALLSAMDAVIKHISPHHATLTIAAGRYLFGAIAAGAIWLHAGRPTLTAEMWRAHGLRGFVIAGSATSFFYALGVLPLAELITLSFIAPLLIPFAAWALNGERPRLKNLATIAVALAGAIYAASAGLQAHGANAQYLSGLAAVAISAVLYAVSIALLRQRADRDGPAVVGLMQTIVPLLILAVPGLLAGPLPTQTTAPWFLIMGLLGAAGWYVLIIAYARTEAQRLAPVEFTALAWAAAFGFFFFAETPRVATMIGAAIIIAACLFAAWDERRTRAA
jgi:drug/metabolite transporter (DMT)-like permease